MNTPKHNVQAHESESEADGIDGGTEPNIPERLSLRLSKSAREVLERLSELRSETNVSELIRRALGTELMLAEAAERGEILLLEKPNGRQVELRPVR